MIWGPVRMCGPEASSGRSAVASGSTRVWAPTVGTLSSGGAPRQAAATSAPLLPLDRRGRLRRDVVDDAIHAGNLVDDPVRDRLEHVIRDPRPVRGHRILGGDGADDDRVGVRPLVA